MKHRVAIFALLLLLGHLAWAGEGWQLDVAYFDAARGALTIGGDGLVPLPDGCIGQIVEDVDGAGAAHPQSDGRAGAGDRMLLAADDRGEELVSFRTNGSQYFDAEGFFRVTLGRHAGELPVRPVFLRVWDSPDFTWATGYWDSPPFRILDGPQQVSFRRDEWVYHRFDLAMKRDADDLPAASEDDPALAENAKLLTAWPNPFNSSARVRLALPNGEPVRVRVFDIQGRVVSTLVEGSLAAGVHDLTVDGSRWPTGLYFLSAEIAGQPAAVERLLLVR
ncbi:MAG: T9SS type A sorting domain-containing protein [bacterium]|nr:T9SS type A sorting domain-containing protein [bacterium]